MKFMLLIYDNADTRSRFFGAEGGALMAEVDALMSELTESGELVGGDALAEPSRTRTVRYADGRPLITDSPLAEAKEQFGGYLLVDVENEHRALDIAARWPNARFAAVEVRAVMDSSGTEM